MLRGVLRVYVHLDGAHKGVRPSVRPSSKLLLVLIIVFFSRKSTGTPSERLSELIMLSAVQLQ